MKASPEAGARSDRGPWPIYPALAAAFPVLATLSANVAIVPAADLGRPLAAALAAGLVLTAAFTRLLRDAGRGGAAALAVVVWVWAYSAILPHLAPSLDAYRWTEPASIGLGLVLAAAAAALRPPVRVLNVAACAVFGVSAASLGWALANPPRPPSPPADVRPLPPGPRPDVYHVVMDGFGRTDVLRRAIGVDLGWFETALRERGFTVAERARSNYVQTELSVTSTLNLARLPDLLPDLSPEADDRRILDRLVADSESARRLRASGYRRIAIGTGFDGLQLGRDELPLERTGGLTLFESTLLARTPFARRAELSSSLYDVHRDRLALAFRRLEELAAPTASPRAVFAHILAPHPPFVFGPNGEPRRPKGPFGYWDASDYLAYVGDEDDYRRGYADQVTWLARRVLDWIDHVRATNPDRPPVIILQGDHGSKVGLDHNDLARTDLDEAFGILYAVSAPADLKFDLPADATPVDTYRRLFTALGADDVPPLGRGSWYSPYGRPFDFTEVTDRLPGQPPSGSASRQR